MKQSFSHPVTSIFSQWFPSILGIAYFAAFLIFLLTRL